MFDTGSEFKTYFTPFLKYFLIKPVLNTINKPQVNAMVERVHKVILNILVTKYLDNKVFDYMDPWSENPASISWVVMAFYHHTVGVTPEKAVFIRDIIFNLTPVVKWSTITAKKKRQVGIDHFQ